MQNTRLPELSTDCLLDLSDDELSVAWEALEFAAEKSEEFAGCFSPWPGREDAKKLLAIVDDLRQIFGWAKTMRATLPAQTVFSTADLNTRVRSRQNA